MATTSITIGLEFRADGIQLAALKRTMNGIHLLLHAHVSLHESGGFYEESESEIAGRIQEVLDSYKIRNGDLYVAFPRTGVILQSLQVPTVAEKDLWQIMRFELERHIPLSANDVYFDVLPQMNGIGNLMKVLLLALPRTALNRCLKVCEILNLPVISVELSIFSLMNVWAANRNRSDLTVRAMAYISNKEIDLCVFQGQNILHSRCLPIPDTLESSDKNAFRRAVGFAIRDELHLFTRRLGDRNSTLRIDEIILCGERIAEPVVVQEIMNITGIKIGFLNPLEQIRTTPVDVPRSMRMAAAVGAAQRAFHSPLVEANFIPPDQRIRRSDRGLLVSGTLFGIVLALLTTLALNSFWQRSLALDSVFARQQIMQPEVNRILKGNAVYKTMQSQMETIRKLRFEQPTKLEILRELTLIMPDGSEDENAKVWLTSFEIESDELILRGKSEKPEGLIEVFDASPFFENARFEGTLTRDNFTIKARVSKKGWRQPEEFEEIPPAEHMPPADETAVSDREENTDGEEVPVEPSPVEERRSGPAVELPPREEPQDAGTSFMDIFRNAGQRVPDSGETEDQEYMDENGFNGEEMEDPGTENDLERAKENLLDFLQQNEEMDEMNEENSTIPEAARSFIEFLQQNEQTGNATEITGEDFPENSGMDDDGLIE